jgi:hypothetical protein
MIVYIVRMQVSDPIKCEETTTIITPNTKFDVGKIIW